jgi:tripartite-type tricarboxylate transporter receptor subunit TctC
MALPFIAKFGKRGLFHRVFAAGVFALYAACASAQTVKLVVPTPAGGAGDTLARVLTEQIRRAHGATLVVENRPGGSTVVGTEAVARATPDGSTLLLAGNGLVVSPHLRKTNYDALTSFEPICHLVNLPMVIAVNTSSPYATLADLFDAARLRPAQLTLASIGPASTAHIAFEMLKRTAKIDMTFVPFSGTAPALNALVGDHVTAFFGNYAEVAGHLKSGTLRALATTSRARAEPLPQPPTLAELGYKMSLGEVWYGLVAPQKTPRDVLFRLANWFTSALEAPDVNAKLVNNGIYPAAMCGEDYGTFLRDQSDEYGRAIREANISP